MKKSILQLTLAILLLLVISSCNKCVQHEIATLKFSQNDLSINPYSGNEILIFKNLNNDSIVLAKASRGTEGYTRYQIDYEEAKEYHHNCQGDYFTSETNWTEFGTIPDDSITSVRINLDFNYTLNNPTSDKNIWLFFYHGNDNSGFWGNYKFNNDSIINYSKKTDSIVAYHTQINIGPKVFNNVYELYAHNEDDRNQEWFSIAYYSIKEGFCGVKSNFGKVWYLDRKIK